MPAVSAPALGTALGAKLAAPKREVIACVGDGSYMFGNPVPHHFVARAENLPTLTVVANNHHVAGGAHVDAVGLSGRCRLQGERHAGAGPQPSPDFEKVIESCGGYGEKVEAPEDLTPALKRSFEALRSGTPALLNVSVQPIR